MLENLRVLGGGSARAHLPRFFFAAYSKSRDALAFVKIQHIFTLDLVKNQHILTLIFVKSI